MAHPIIVATEGVELPENGFYYVIAANGIFFHKNTGLINALVRVDGIPNLVEMKPKVKFTLPPIPINLLDLSYTFFKIIYDYYQTEAGLMLLFNRKTQTYNLYCPEQTVDMSGVHYAATPHLKDWAVVGSIHSHADSPAFHSGIDTHDEEQFDGLHLTLGDLHHNCTTLSMEMAVNANRFKPKSLEGWIPGIDDRKVENLKPAQLSFIDQLQNLPMPQEEIAQYKWCSDMYPINYVVKTEPFFKFIMHHEDRAMVMKEWFKKVILDLPEHHSYYSKPVTDKLETLAQVHNQKRNKFKPRNEKQPKGVTP